MHRSIVLLLMLCALITANAGADDDLRQFSSDQRHVPMVELFTSEGCSSCPPAERWLNSLLDDDGLWRDFVPAAFHVDYWNYLGWQDPYSRTAHSVRQRRYIQQGAATTVYTPGVFVNGREWRGWIQDQPIIGSGNPGALTVTTDGSSANIEFIPTSAMDNPLLAHISLLAMGLQSAVDAGENRGRLLQHEFVVVGTASTAMSRAGEVYRAQLSIPAASILTARYALAAWVTTADSLAPLQATGGSLND